MAGRVAAWPTLLLRHGDPPLPKVLLRKMRLEALHCVLFHTHAQVPGWPRQVAAPQDRAPCAPFATCALRLDLGGSAIPDRSRRASGRVRALPGSDPPARSSACAGG